MPNITVLEPAAGSAVGTDLLTNAPPNIKRSPLLRKVQKVGLVGSAAVGDCAVDLYYGASFVGRFYNTSAGANLRPLEAKDMVKITSDLVMEPNEDLTLVIFDIGATNIMSATLYIDDLDPESL